MNNQKVLDDTIFEIEGLQIESRRKSPLASIILLVVGLAMMVSAFKVEAIKASANLSSALIFIGFIVAFAGFVKILMVIFGKGRPVINGRSLRRYTFKHDTPMREQARKALSEGDFKTLSEIPHGQTSAILSVVYKTDDDQIAIAQTLEYVPHTYNPITEIFTFKKGEFTKGENFK